MDTDTAKGLMIFFFFLIFPSKTPPEKLKTNAFNSKPDTKFVKTYLNILLPEWSKARIINVLHASQVLFNPSILACVVMYTTLQPYIVQFQLLPYWV